MFTISNNVNPIYPDLENKFPTAIDNIVRMRDPSTADLPAINRYYAYIAAENLIAAEAILDQNPTLKQVVINADNLNQIFDAVISIERHYASDFQSYIMQAIKYKDEWNSSTKYRKFDVVTYIRNGAIESYMGIVEEVPIGTLPTNKNYYTPLTLRGEQGASGTGLSYRGSWNSIIQYYKDDCISHNNLLWAAKVNNINKAPQNISEAWEPVLNISKQIVFSATEPIGQATDEIWFKTLGANACEIYQMQSTGTYKLMLVNANNALSANSVAWNNVSGKPTDWAPSAHNHDNLYLSKNGGVINGNLAVTGSLSGMTYSNDYAEYRQSQKYVRGGQIVIEDIANDDYVCESNARLNPTAMIVSDTYGMVIGIVDNDCAFPLPIAVSGRALVYPCEDRSSFKIGDCVCSGEHGTVSRMSEAEIKQYPHCIVGVVSSIPMYHLWGGNSVDVDGRIWVRIR